MGYTLDKGLWEAIRDLQGRVEALEGNRGVVPNIPKPPPVPPRRAEPLPTDENGVIKKCGNCDHLMAGTAVCGIDNLGKDLSAPTDCADWRWPEEPVEPEALSRDPLGDAVHGGPEAKDIPLSSLEGAPVFQRDGRLCIRGHYDIADGQWYRDA